MLRIMNKDPWDEVAIQKVILKEKAERANEKAQQDTAERHDSNVDLTEDTNL